MSMESLSFTADFIIRKREEIEEIEELLKVKNQQLDNAESFLKNEMAWECVKNFTHAGKIFYLSKFEKLNVNSQLSEEFYKYLKENKLGDMIKEVVQGRTLKAWFGELEEEKQRELIKDRMFLSLYEDIKLGVRKSTKKQ